MLNYEQLQAVVSVAQQRFTLIRQKYPGLKAYLVFSSPAGQARLGGLPAQILDEFPAMVFNDASTSVALPMIERLKEENIPASEKQRLNSELENLGKRFKYDSQCRIELRFDELKYELIWKLQADELVDRNLTPQIKASFRIVLGTLEQFTNAGKLQ